MGVAGYCDERICLCACLSLCEHISGTAYSIFFIYFLHVTYGRGSVLVWQRPDTSCTSDFTDDVTFAHDRLYGGLSIPLRRVTSLRRRAQAKTPLLRRIGCVMC